MGLEAAWLRLAAENSLIGAGAKAENAYPYKYKYAR
jgi:hypothetical protein